MLIQNHWAAIVPSANESPDPTKFTAALPPALDGLSSRFTTGGSRTDSSGFRETLSRMGTFLSNTPLGMKMKDMTSGFPGFHREVLGRLLDYSLRSKAYLFQTKVRYLPRHRRYAEAPIRHRAPFNNVGKTAIDNALDALKDCFLHRLTGRAVRL